MAKTKQTRKAPAKRRRASKATASELRTRIRKVLDDQAASLTPRSLQADRSIAIVQAMTGLRTAARMLRELARDEAVEGMCSECGCAELEGCEAGCFWVSRDRTLCSRCV